MIQTIIYYLQLFLFIFLLISPFVDECAVKLNAFIFINFIIFHFITKYGKCGIINIERFFLEQNFKNGFFYKLIKPVIGYKENIFYDKLFYMLVIYSIVLLIQIYNQKCFKKMYNVIIEIYNKFWYKK
jgi:hypothetical protein